MNIPCPFHVDCRVPLKGEYHAVFVGNFRGTIDADFNGTIIGNFHGTINGDFNGTIIGDFTGTINGDFTGTITGDFNGSITGDFTGTISGDFNGTIDGEFTGTIDGAVNITLGGSLDADVNGTVTGTFDGDVDGTVNITLTGSLDADVTGTITGTFNGDFDGTITGTVTGTVNGEFTGHLTGTFTGTIDGVPFDGPINQDVDGVIIGTFNGTMVGDFDGTITGTITGTVDANLDGDFTGTITGTIDGEVTGTITGTVNANLDGDFTGTIVGDIDGTVTGTVTGTVDGVIDGTLTDGNLDGDLDGTIDGTLTGGTLDGEFNGSLNGDFNGRLDGDFGGSLDGEFNGHLDGTFDGYFNGRLDGVLDGDFNGTIDGVPTDPNFPYNNTSAELPDTTDGFPPPNFQEDPLVFPPTDIPGGGPNADGNPTLPPIIFMQFNNDEQSCTRTCPDLSEYTATVPAGLFTLSTQAGANAAAMALACELADIFCETGTVPPLVTNTPQTCVVACSSGGSNSFTALVGTWSDISQSAANSGALSHACIMASLTCPVTLQSAPLPPGGSPGGLPEFPEQRQNQRRVEVAYTNSAQIASSTCPNGGTFSYTAPSYRFFGNSPLAANNMARTYAENQVISARYCIDQTSIEACLNAAIASPISLFGQDSAPISWNVTNLPAGLTFTDTGTNGRLMQISGTPTSSGLFEVTFQADYLDPGFGQISKLVKTVPFYVSEITTSSLPNGTVGVAYSQTLAGTGFPPGSLWEIVSGTFPDDLSIDLATGAITGTPTIDGAYNFDVKRGGCTKNFSFSIASSASCGWWSDFPLANDNVPVSPGVTATTTPSTLTGVTDFSMSLQVPTDAPDGNTLSCSGTKVYTGPAVILKFHVDVTTFETGLGEPAYIDIYVLGNLVGEMTAVGGYDYTVEIPVGVAAPIDVSVSIFRGAQFDAGTIACDVSLIACESTIGALDGFAFIDAQPLFFYGTTGAPNPSATITIASNGAVTWDVGSVFSSTIWAVAPTVTLDGVPLTLHNSFGNWVLDLVTISTDSCTVKTFQISGPTVGDPTGGGSINFYPQA